MNARARSTVAIGLVEVEINAVEHELDHFRKHPRLLAALIKMPPQIAHQFLENREFKKKPLHYLNAPTLSAQQLHDALKALAKK